MKSKAISCSDRVGKILKKLSVSRTSTVQEADRAKLILLLLSGSSNLHISKTTSHSWDKVKRWRDRWLSYEAVFSKIESRANQYHLSHDLEQKVRECLKDAPRSGSPGKFSAEQYCQILGVSLEAPELSGRPISVWTLDELVDEVQKRGIVEKISRSQVGSFLKRERSESA